MGSKECRSEAEISLVFDAFRTLASPRGNLQLWWQESRQREPGAAGRVAAQDRDEPDGCGPRCSWSPAAAASVARATPTALSPRSATTPTWCISPVTAVTARCALPGMSSPLSSPTARCPPLYGRGPAPGSGSSALSARPTVRAWTTSRRVGDL